MKYLKSKSLVSKIKKEDLSKKISVSSLESGEADGLPNQA